MISMWIKNGTSLIVMIDLLKMYQEELDKAAYNINGQRANARLEVSPQRRPKPCFSKDSRRWEGTKVEAFHGKLHISFLAEGELAAKYTREGKGHADEGWFIDKGVMSKRCTVFTDILFETVVKSS